MPELARRLDTRRGRLAAALLAVLCELAIALPFLVISPNTLCGVPGPLLVVVGVAASYLLGPWLWVPVTAVGVLLAVTIVGENAWAEPLVCCCPSRPGPASWASGCGTATSCAGN